MRSGTPLRNAGDIDDSDELAVRQILHRVLPDGSGQDYFVYRGGGGRRDGMLFVAVHDISRNAREQAEAFAPICERYDATLVAPHFSAELYPNYQRLGRSRHIADKGRYADAALVAILDDVARLSGQPVDGIYLFGFGAGARFALRYAMAYPGRVEAVVVAAADAFTAPDPDKPFPRGIGKGNKRQDLNFEPENFLRVPITVLEGARDESSASRPRAVRVVRPPGFTPRHRAKGWIAAMQSAAKVHHVSSRVAYRELDVAMDSFGDCVRDGELAERVFHALLVGPLAGLPAVIVPAATVEPLADSMPTPTPAPTPDRGVDRRRWLTVRPPAAEEQFLTGAPQSSAQRRLLPAVLVAVLVAILAPLGIWANYRAGHVVSQDAVVRSYIADVGARVDGVVQSVEVDTGDRVRAGQVIARLEDQHFVARVNRARSRLETARRELEVEGLAIENERQRLSGSLREVSAGLSAARAAVLASESRAAEAERQVELQRSLVSQGLVPAERARTAETQFRTAQALTAEARATVAAAGAGEDLARVASNGITVREKRVSVLESEIAGYQAELAAAEANLEATVLRAPDDGAVVRRIVQPGGSITVGQPAISLWVGGKIWVEAWLDEDALGSIAVGSPATVTFKSHPNREFTGRVETLGVSTDLGLPDTEVMRPREQRMRDAPVISVRIRLDEPAADLFPGLSAVVGIRKKAE